MISDSRPSIEILDLVDASQARLQSAKTRAALRRLFRRSERSLALAFVLLVTYGVWYAGDRLLSSWQLF